MIETEKAKVELNGSKIPESLRTDAEKAVRELYPEADIVFSDSGLGPFLLKAPGGLIFDATAPKRDASEILLRGLEEDLRKLVVSKRL